MNSSSPNKRQLALLLFLSWSSAAQGFAIPHDRTLITSTLCMNTNNALETSSVTTTAATRSSSLASTSSDFDFPSAMPEKPEISMEEKMNQSADDFLENMDNALADKSTAPPELAALKDARKANTPASEIKVYDLMIERAMLFDEDPDTASLTPTGFDIPNNLDVPEIIEEFKHLYSYRMMLMNKGLLDGEVLKETVVERLIKRTGLSPEEFDKWLGY